MNTDKNHKPTLRDFSKPIVPIFKGKKGHHDYIEIATAPPTKYNAEFEKQKAAENLRKQGLFV